MKRELRDVVFYSSTDPSIRIFIVAAVNRDTVGSIFDWAAYIGCGAAVHVASHGEKLLDRQAAGFFPDLPIGLYRA